MKQLRNVWKAAALVALSALLIVALSLTGIFLFIVYSSGETNSWNASLQRISDALIVEDGTYLFTDPAYLQEKQLWAMLIDGETGAVIWEQDKPDSVPSSYTISDVASFTRWYLDDYPVQVLIREDGLLVAGSPRNSTWKYSFAMDMATVQQTPYWFCGLFLLSLGTVLAVAALLLHRWFRRDQQVRDAARSDWINGISHDIRTPLSIVMGYAGQLEEDRTLPPERRKQAGIIRRQSQVIRNLVNDLNLTMRLDCQMQALRKETLQPEALVRQAVADLLNSGMAEGFSVEMELPETPLPAVEADGFLLRRALNNLLGNCVQHNEPPCLIRVGARWEGHALVLWVEGGNAAGDSAPQRQLEADGGAAHGTGLKLVRQIAAAHGGQAKFYQTGVFGCALFLPPKSGGV